jgi:hypothetical protein
MRGAKGASSTGLLTQDNNCFTYLTGAFKASLFRSYHVKFLIIYFMQDLLSKAITNLSFFIWTHELLPLDILLLALIDRDDDPYALRLVVKTIKTFQSILFS